MMKPAVSSRILLCAALAFALGNCTQVLKDNKPKPLQTLSCGNSAENPGTIRPEILQQSRSAYLAEAGRTLASDEMKLPGDKDTRCETLAELARLCFTIGALGEKHRSEDYYQKGRSYAEVLCREQPGRVEGHYWLALNVAGLCEVGSAGTALRSLPGIVEQLEIALTIDERYDQAGAHRVLGRICCEAPCWPLSEGDLDKSLQHLRTAVKIAPDNSTNHLYLALTLMQFSEYEEACLELKRTLAARCHSVWPCGFTEDHQRAFRLIKEYENSGGEAPAANSGASRTGRECVQSR